MSVSSQQFETYVPVYDVVPEKWEEARPFLVEMLKKITNSLNSKEVGFFLDEELLSGKSFIPGVTIAGNNPGQFRSLFRKVIDVSPLAVGANVFAHGIQFDSNFTLIEMYVGATNSLTLNAICLTDTSVTLDATNINITSPAIYDRAFCIIEYCLEV